MRHEPRITGRVLGERAVQVDRLVRAYFAEHGIAPSYGIICDELNMDRGNLSRVIARMEKRGLLARAGRGRVRRIRLAF